MERGEWGLCKRIEEKIENIKSENTFSRSHGSTTQRKRRNLFSLSSISNQPRSLAHHNGRPFELERSAAEEPSRLYFPSAVRASAGRSGGSEQWCALAFIAVNQFAGELVVFFVLVAVNNATRPQRQDRPLPLRSLQLGPAAEDVFARPCPVPGTGEESGERKKSKRRKKKKKALTMRKFCSPSTCAPFFRRKR